MAKRVTEDQQAPEISVQVGLDVKPDTPSYYVNFVAVSHTPYDFTLSAVKVPSPLTEDQAQLAKNGKPIPLEPILQLVIPALLVDGLIKALQDQKTKHEKTVAKQVRNNDIQHRIKANDPVQ